jgi:ABC-type nitrate/sulfonate/bicarbonate transport system substrate-binding protein
LKKESIRRIVLRIAFRVRPVLIVLMAFAALSLSAGTTGESTAEPAVPVTLMLDWVPNVNHVGLYVARDLGFFADQGLDVTIIQPGEVFATAAVVSGQADFGIDFQESMTMLRAQGVPLVSIAAILQENTSGFAVRAGEGISSPADFAGLTYGTFNSPYEEPTLSGLVNCVGGDASSIAFVTAGTDLLVMLERGLADLVWIYYGTQGFQAERIGLEIDYFPLSDYADCIPNYYTPVVITSEAMLRDDPELVRSFLAALSEAHEYVMAEPADAARVLAGAVPELDADELAASVPWVAGYMDSPSGWGHQDLQTWEEYGEWMANAGVLEGDFDPAAAFTSDFLPEN